MNRLTTGASLIAAAVLACTVAAPASAAGSDALSQYLVSGKAVDTDALARAGYDVLEGSSAKGGVGIVATRAQAARLRRDEKGATVEPLTAETRAATPRVGASGALPNPTHGYDVFRPWSLTPAPCPGTCARPNVPLKQLYATLAATHPDIVKRKVIGHSVRGQEIIAYRVTKDVNASAEGSKPAVLYEATQHAREWISAEVEYRLFSHVLTHTADADIASILAKTELWFIPIVNPDGYDYTFTAAGNRLWRKNLRDVDGDGQITSKDGVDTNRNWPTHWNFDLEGASDDSTTETYHGASAGSEPEVQAARGLIAQLKPKFLIDYHSYAQLILYPFGFQVETPSTDAPLLAALAGSDRRPAVDGFDPDVSAELYTTNGDVTDDALTSFGVMAYTVELDGGSGDTVGGTDDSDDGAYEPGGFVYQDSEADIAAEASKNLQFALDLARGAPDPADAQSHLGDSAPPMVPRTFSESWGSDQAVEVNAKRALGDVTLKWQVDGDGTVHSAGTAETAPGVRYGQQGTYFHRLRGTVTNAKLGDTVRVWFEGGGQRSPSFSYTVAKIASGPVLVMAAEDATGASSDPPDADAGGGGAKYVGAYTTALDDAHIAHDVYDTDARGRRAPDALGVLSHYKAVVWETGDDLFTREPDQPAGTGVSKLLDDEIVNVRDFLNEGGKLLTMGKNALLGAQDGYLYNPLQGQPGAPYCNSNVATGDGDADDPPGQPENCVGTSNDFLQYWLGSYLPITLASDADGAAALPFQAAGGAFGSTAFRLNGADSAKNQDLASASVTTSSILPKDRYPQFASSASVKLDRPPAFDPPDGTHYAAAASSDESWQRLRTTVDLTKLAAGKAADLSFKVSYDTEPTYDFFFVEAHTVGKDDWTTLPDVNGHTDTDDTLASCEIDWDTIHPFVAHYQTNPAGDANPCTAKGTTGEWHAATGNSGGFVDWKADLAKYAGKKVELSLTYAQDFGTGGLGVYVDDAKTTVDGAVTAQTSFEDGLGGFVAGPPPAGTANRAAFASRTSVGIVDAPGVATDRTLYWTFGLEGVTDRATRAALLSDGLRYLGVTGSAPAPAPAPIPAPPPTPAPAPSPSPAKTAKLGLLFGKSVRLSKLGSVPLKVKCSPALGDVCRLTLRLRTAGKGPRTLGTKKIALRPGRSTTATVKLSTATRRTIRRRGHLSAAVSLVSATSGTTKLTAYKRITVRSRK